MHAEVRARTGVSCLLCRFHCVMATSANSRAISTIQPLFLIIVMPQKSLTWIVSFFSLLSFFLYTLYFYFQSSANQFRSFLSLWGAFTWESWFQNHGQLMAFSAPWRGLTHQPSFLHEIPFWSLSDQFVWNCCTYPYTSGRPDSFSWPVQPRPQNHKNLLVPWQATPNRIKTHCFHVQQYLNLGQIMKGRNCDNFPSHVTHTVR